jgi:hypothetical protein
MRDICDGVTVCTVSEPSLKSIIEESICRNFQGGMTGTSTYVHSYIVCFKCFLDSRCLLY